LNKRHVRRDARAILDVVSSTLNKSVDVVHQQAILQAVWADGLVAVVLPKSRKLATEL